MKRKCDSCGKFAKEFVWVGDGQDEGTECEHCTSQSGIEETIRRMKESGEALNPEYLKRVAKHDERGA